MGDGRVEERSDSLLALLWGQRPAGTRGPKPVLDLEQLAAAGIAIADEAGLEAVSMQAVADRVGFSKMSLYRHVATKDELLGVMIDAAVGEPPDLLAVRGGWRPRLEAYAEAMWQAWQQHPWVPAATVGTRIMGPNEVGWVDQALRSLHGTGLEGEERIDAVLLVGSQVRITHSLATSGPFPWNDRRQLRSQLATVIREHPDRFTGIVDSLDSASARPVAGVRDGLGLSCILDGLDKRITHRRRQNKRAGPRREPKSTS